MHARHCALRRCARSLLLAMIAGCLGTRAARAQVALLGSGMDERTVQPGDSYTGSIVVRNLTSAPQSVRLYQTDYTFAADGSSHFDPPGALGRSNARWVSLSTQQLVVPARSDASVAYTVTVPATDTLRGTFWSMIMVEGASVPAMAAAGQRRVGIGVVTRYAVQIATNMQETGARKVAFASHQLVVEQDSTRALAVVVQNAGERAYHPLLWIEVYDATGALRLKTKQQRGLLYPGTSLTQDFALRTLGPGSYKAVVFADVGDDEVFAAQYKLVL